MTPGQFFAVELAAAFAALTLGSWWRWEGQHLFRDWWDWHQEAHAMWVQSQRDAAVRRALTPPTRRHPTMRGRT